MSDTIGRCMDCYYWHNGQCRESSPVAANNRNSYVDIRGVWPLTHAVDFCGKFKVKRKRTKANVAKLTFEEVPKVDSDSGIGMNTCAICQKCGSTLVRAISVGDKFVWVEFDTGDRHFPCSE